MKAYFISGIAADKRIFNRIHLPMGFEPIFIDWIRPIHGETLGEYGLRLACAIDQQEPYILIGLSLGGLIATEISRHYRPVTTILISSIPLASHLPRWIRLAGKIQLHKMIPGRVVKSASLAKLFFSDGDPLYKTQLRAMIRESDPDFIRWAMDAVMRWENTALPDPYIHIHGAMDEVFPVWFTKPHVKIKKGGHTMVVTRADIINEILQEKLSGISKGSGSSSK